MLVFASYLFLLLVSKPLCTSTSLIFSLIWFGVGSWSHSIFQKASQLVMMCSENPRPWYHCEIRRNGFSCLDSSLSLIVHCLFIILDSGDEGGKWWGPGGSVPEYISNKRLFSWPALASIVAQPLWVLHAFEEYRSFIFIHSLTSVIVLGTAVQTKPHSVKCSRFETYRYGLPWSEFLYRNVTLPSSSFFVWKEWGVTIIF